mmetsp:Transcript_23693/g.49370  ORF Transcript_23693/g.49370 Transcript_23693/m.49370 type:complete len:115 (-) Transcript_23693:131-475(-)
MQMVCQKSDSSNCVTCRNCTVGPTPSDMLKQSATAEKIKGKLPGNCLIFLRLSSITITMKHIIPESHVNTVTATWTVWTHVSMLLLTAAAPPSFPTRPHNKGPHEEDLRTTVES